MRSQEIEGRYCKLIANGKIDLLTCIIIRNKKVGIVKTLFRSQAFSWQKAYRSQVDGDLKHTVAHKHRSLPGPAV